MLTPNTNSLLPHWLETPPSLSQHPHPSLTITHTHHLIPVTQHTSPVTQQASPITITHHTTSSHSLPNTTSTPNITSSLSSNTHHPTSPSKLHPSRTTSSHHPHLKSLHPLSPNTPHNLPPPPQPPPQRLAYPNKHYSVIEVARRAEFYKSS